MPTRQQYESFNINVDKTLDSEMDSRTLLDNSIGWVCDNLHPEEVFSDSALERWADKNGYIKQLP